jgi:hypothetical protein
VLALTSLHARSDSIQELESRLVRAPPVSTAFVEYRFSHVLKAPLRTSGTLEYRADGVLARDVREPFIERTEVSADEIRIQRSGRAERRIPLGRAPQLRVLLGSFRALLDGRISQLEQDFEITLSGDASRWTLSLRPRDKRLARYLASIEVYGAVGRPHCLEAVEPDGDATLTLFEAHAERASARADLERICRNATDDSAPHAP